MNTPSEELKAKADGVRAKKAGRTATKTTLTASTASTAAETAAVEVTTAVKRPDWPEPIAEEAFHGIAGEAVAVLDPGSEADKVAVLIQLLVVFGVLIGRSPHYKVSGSCHRSILFAVLVGPTAAGRKGTSFDMVRMLIDGIDDAWMNGRVMNGLSSGEGLLWSVRDPIKKLVEVKQRGCPSTFEEVEADPGVTDKRLLVQEPEFASVLKMQERQGNSLSPVIRKAWDSPPLMQNMTKNSPDKATDAHVGIIGHITAVEFTRCLTSTEAANGGANRNLIACVRRSKLLPDGGTVDADRLKVVRERVREAVAFASKTGEVTRHPNATPLWHGVYELLTDGRDGLHGSLTARAAPQVLRLAMIYALLDLKEQISPDHLLAALAVWDYCDRSTAFLFADRTGNPLADEIRDLLRQTPAGLTRTEIQTALGKHQFGDRLTQALQALEAAKLARMEKIPTGGRSSERWFATGNSETASELMTIARREYAKCGESGESGESPCRRDQGPQPDDSFAATPTTKSGASGEASGVVAPWNDLEVMCNLTTAAGWKISQCFAWLDATPTGGLRDMSVDQRRRLYEHLTRLTTKSEKT